MTEIERERRVHADNGVRSRIEAALEQSLARKETPEVIYALLRGLAETLEDTSAQAARDVRRSAATLRPLFGSSAQRYWLKLRRATPMRHRLSIPRTMPNTFPEQFTRSELAWGRQVLLEAHAAGERGN